MVTSRWNCVFESDLFSPGIGAAPTPAATHLLQITRLLRLDVETLAGGHGGVGPFDELVRAVGVSGENQPALASPPPPQPPLFSMRH